MDYARVVDFHGHECPGLAIGYRMSKEAMEFLGLSRSGDEEIVAMVENNACGTDALQCVTGCTFGKGNLIFKDYGKHVYTIYSRKSKEGVRVVFHGNGIPEGLRKDRKAFIKWILSSPADEMLSLRRVIVEEPEPARIFKSLTCSVCGEKVMETRIRIQGERILCIPCHESNRK